MDCFFRSDTFAPIEAPNFLRTPTRWDVVRGDTPAVRIRFIDPETGLAVDPFGEVRHSITLLLGAADLVNLAPAGTEDGAMTYDGFALYVTDDGGGDYSWHLAGELDGAAFTGTTAAAAAAALAEMLGTSAAVSGATVTPSGSVFTYSGTALATITASASATWLFSAKTAADYGSDPLTSTTVVTRSWADVADPYWVVYPNLNTAPLNTALGVGGEAEIAYIDLDAQFEATFAGNISSTQRFTLRVSNDVARGSDPLFSGDDPWPFPIVGSAAITGAITLTKSSFGIVNICSGSSANYTIDLPDPTDNAGKTISFIMSSSLTKLVTLNAGSASIDGATTRIMWSGESCNLYCDGTNYFKTSGKSIPMVCKMRMVTTGTAVANNAVTTLSLNGVISDTTGAMASLANGRIDVVRTSIYHVTGYINWGNTGGISRAITIASLTSGAEIVSAECTVLSGVYGGSYAQAAKAISAADSVILRGYQNGGSTYTPYVTASTANSSLELIELPQW